MKRLVLLLTLLCAGVGMGVAVGVADEVEVTPCASCPTCHIDHWDESGCVWYACSNGAYVQDCSPWEFQQ